MDFQQLLSQMTPAIYQNLRQAVETGKWQDGRAVTAEQRASSLQLILAWDTQHLPPEERIGFIHTKPHEHCEHDDHERADIEQPLRWQE